MLERILSLRGPGPPRPGARVFVALLLVPVAVAGCGSSNDQRKAEKRSVTAPAYGTFHATTQPVTAGTPATCRRAAEAFTRNAVAFLVPSPTPPDQYFVSARTQFVDFEAHSCDPSFLRGALSSKLSAKQRRIIVARFPFLGGVGRELD